MSVCEADSPSGAGAGADAEDVLAALLAAARVMVGLTVGCLARLDVDLTLPQYRLLVVLAVRPRRTVDLAAELGIAPSTATRTCDRLVRRELVRRFQRPDDRRVSWLALTERGKDLIGAAMRLRRAETVKLVEAAGLRAQRGLSAALSSFVVAAGELPEREWWRRWERSTGTDPAILDQEPYSALRGPGRVPGVSCPE